MFYEKKPAQESFD